MKKDLTIIALGILEEAMMVKTPEDNDIQCRFKYALIKPLDSESIKKATEKRWNYSVRRIYSNRRLGSAISEYAFKILSDRIFISMGLKDTFSSVVGDQKYLRKPMVLILKL